jgi:hypothetical protein
MKLISLFENMLQEVSMEQLKQQFVDAGKIKPEDFKAIEDATGNKSAYATWLIKKVAEKVIKGEDVYKFKNYFLVFDRNKRIYPQPDINSYKSKDEVAEFIKKSVEIARKNSDDPSTQKGVSKDEKYKEFKMGNVDGFEVYKIPKGRRDLHGVACELGSGTEWCTATGKTDTWFQQYIKDDSLYIFIKGKEKYQLHFEDGQFMDKEDTPMNDDKQLETFIRHLMKIGEKLSGYFELVYGGKKIIEGDILCPMELQNKKLKIPDGLTVKGGLYLIGCTDVELGSNVTVEGNASLYYCKVNEIPDNWTISGRFEISYTNIDDIPNNLKIGKYLNMYHTPLYKKYTIQEVQKLIKQRGGYLKYLGDEDDGW